MLVVYERKHFKNKYFGKKKKKLFIMYKISSSLFLEKCTGDI